MAAESPNRKASHAQLRIMNLARSYPQAVHRLMQIGDEVLLASRQTA
jgi:hypothetical protein